MKKRFLSILLCLMMVVGMLPTTALAAAVRDDDGNIHYEPTEQGVHSNGGYVIDKISHPDLGAGEIDGILTGDDQDRGNSYSWSMADGGEDSDYIYIGTCYNSTYYIYHNNVKTSLDTMKKEGKLPETANTSEMAADIVSVMFGVDTFDESQMNDWTPVIISVNKKTGEAKVVFRERDVWADNPTIFPGYSAQMPTKNYLSGYRMVCEFEGKLYFAGMGNPTATLVEVDPKTNEAKIAYYNIRYTRGVSNGVHGLITYDGEILMCLATDDYDGKKTPGGIIVASSNPSAGPSEWRVIADQDDFDGLPAVMQVDGLNGGGIWDIIEYNGHLYVTVVTDKSTDGKINKQGFAMYRGDKKEDGSFTWTQVVGPNGTSGIGYGMGINYSMSCNMWVYDGYLYMGTYNDPMLDLAEVPATGNFELLYNDLDHSIYLYRMNENEEFEQVGGKDDNPNFPDGPIGNLGAGLGNNSNQYVWRMGVHNGEFYIGTYDTSTLTYQFTQLTDGAVANMDYDDIKGRSDALRAALDQAMGEYQDNQLLGWFLDKTVFSDYTAKVFQELSRFATAMSEDKNPVPDYRDMISDYESFKKDIYQILDGLTTKDAAAFAAAYPQEAAEIAVDSVPGSIEADQKAFLGLMKVDIRAMVDAIFETYDKAVYDETIHNFVYYFGCNFYAQSSEKGFDLLVSNDGVNFDAITRDGFGDGSNHGLRCITSTDEGLFLGTANPYYGTQLWLLHGENEEPEEPEKPSKKHKFIDVPEGAYYEKAVDWAVENDITNGITDITFCPNAVCNRAQAVTFLWRAAGCPVPKSTEMPFTDVKEGRYYYNAVLWAAENGITKGTTETTFSPNASCTRAQIVTLVHRSGLAVDKNAEPGENPFTDVNLNSFYGESVLWAVANNITNGTTATTFSPNNKCQRAEIITFLWRAMTDQGPLN